VYPSTKYFTALPENLQKIAGWLRCFDLRSLLSLPLSPFHNHGHNHSHNHDDDHSGHDVD
jgi:hypothetical protein